MIETGASAVEDSLRFKKRGPAVLHRPDDLRTAFDVQVRALLSRERCLCQVFSRRGAANSHRSTTHIVVGRADRRNQPRGHRHSRDELPQPQRHTLQLRPVVGVEPAEQMLNLRAKSGTVKEPKVCVGGDDKAGRDLNAGAR